MQGAAWHGLGMDLGTDMAGEQSGERGLDKVMDMAADQAGAPRVLPADEAIAADATQLSEQLRVMRDRLFPPAAQKTLRTFSSGEAARLIGVSDGYLRQLSIAGEGPQPETGVGGRRFYSLADINALRHYLADQARAKGNLSKARSYVKWRNPEQEHLQVIAVTNFKGGSGKTTTSAHMAQHLALSGYRVLAVDLDPQASLSALFGYQPEIDLSGNDTLYGAIRYDEERRPLSDIIRKTYFDGLDIVPGNLELHEFEHTTPRMLAERGPGSTPDDFFFARIQGALASVADDYDVVVIDCPPQLGFLTLSALCASTSVIVTVHPQMLDVASMSQFLYMTADLLSVVRSAGGTLNFDFLRYLVTRYEPNDGPQTQIVGFLRSQFGSRVLTAPMVKSTAISDAGLTKQTLYEVGRDNFTRSTYDRAMEALTSVNDEIETLIEEAWGRNEAGDGA
ncbi:plasmid replication protein RepA2 [Nitratireductor indicus C115]|uniref:Plasmid replication protein RepA2 n=2 Tax=Nitratireductor indicus TaxID=721133 RepID=K2PQE7_9HYPH|nr:plasmid replication protein RepA2 [Nitratireductor indicus C115]SFQ54231.1 chromosome partitioning protein [Nitratireductor indicus]